MKHRNPLRSYLVVTPPYEYVDVIEDGWGPISNERDVIEVMAYTKREAVIIGVREMRTKPGYHWVRDTDTNPYVGIKAYLNEDEGD